MSVIQSARPTHHSCWPKRVDGRIRVGSLTLPEVAAIAGRTPFYVYDRELIAERVATLRSALPDSIQLHYAIKANPMPSVVQHLARLVDGLDVASQGELRTALATPVPAREISFAGPGKSATEIRAAVAAGVVVIAESAAQIRNVAAAAESLGKAARLALRANPAFELKSSGMKMTGGSKPFGIDTEQLPEAVALARELGLEVEGLHLFCGSQNLRAEAICEAHREATLLAISLCESLQLGLRFINIGGGLGIPYFPGERPVDLAAVGDELHRLSEQVRRQLGETSLVMELGRYLVGEAGLYVCRVIETKISRGRRYAIVDGGLHHHLANSGNFGQVIRKNYPVEVEHERPQGHETVTIVGPLCTPLDIVADQIDVGPLEPGDWVIVRQSGAYGASASPQAFLGHPEVVELLL